MIIYATCRTFMNRTFILVTQPDETIARLRAQLMHILYEIGHEKHQFRLRFNGQYLRDASMVGDSGIADNSVVNIVTTALHNVPDSSFFKESTANPTPQPTNETPDIYSALHREITKFNTRESCLKNFRTLLYALCLSAIFSAFTVHWYAIFWTGLLGLCALRFRPVYTRIGGYVGNNTLTKKTYCTLYGVASIVVMIVAISLSTFYWVKIANHGCRDFLLIDDCSHRNVYTAVYFGIEALILLMSSVLAWILLDNFKYEVGDFIEEFLTRERNVGDILVNAQSTSLNDKRSAAFELAAIASTENDDDKFSIVAEGGLDVLITLTLSPDHQTQEHSIEALLNLISIPSIRDVFVEMGGIRTITALLNSSSLVAMETAAHALYVITSECGNTGGDVINGHGLEDVCHAATNGTDSCKQLIASVYLELAFESDVRDQMVARNSTVRGLCCLCESDNESTLMYTLQALELLALSSPDMITSHEKLLSVLTCIPSRVHDDKISLLVAKILLYYAESHRACESLLYQKHTKTTLSLLSQIPDAVIQQVVVKIIASFVNNDSLRIQATDKGLTSVVEYLRENAISRDIWVTADQVVQAFEKGEAIPSQKAASLRQFGSQGSLTSMSRIKSAGLEKGVK